MITSIRICDWHNPPCGKPARNRVNFEDGPKDLCDEAIREIQEADPELLQEMKP